jgi:hypothetical protein
MNAIPQRQIPSLYLSSKPPIHTVTTTSNYESSPSNNVIFLRLDSGTHPIHRDIYPKPKPHTHDPALHNASLASVSINSFSIFNSCAFDFLLGNDSFDSREKLHRECFSHIALQSFNTQLPCPSLHNSIHRQSKLTPLIIA